jgi:hypothetical protein
LEGMLYVSPATSSRRSPPIVKTIDPFTTIPSCSLG